MIDDGDRLIGMLRGAGTRPAVTSTTDFNTYPT